MAGCSDNTVGPDDGPREPASIEVEPGEVVLTSIGDTLRFKAAFFDEAGQPYAADLAVSWSIGDTMVAAIDSTGRIEARGNGSTLLTAAVGTRTGTATVLVEQTPATLTLAAADSVLEIGDSTNLSAEVFDRAGNAMPGIDIDWSSSDTLVASVDSAGAVGAISPGRAVITAAAGGAKGQIEVEVVPVSLAITGISPEVLRPGAEAEVYGKGFSLAARENVVDVNGVEATVLSAERNRLRIWIPYRDRFDCAPRREVAVSVTIGEERTSFEHELAVARAIELGRGEEVFLSGNELDCLEIPEASGRYLVGVYNTATSATSASAFQLRGWDGMLAASEVDRGEALLIDVSPSRVIEPLVFRGPEEEARALEEARHLDLLERDLRLFDELGPWRAPADRIVSSADYSPPDPPAVGTIIPFRVPDARSNALCNNYTDIQARVVHVGPRTIVLEDVAAPLAGTADSLHILIAEELERDMLPIIEEYFGNPFAMVEKLGSDGRIRMVYSKLVNDAGYGGFVFNGDQRDPSQCASSSMAPTFYATVPLVEGSGYSANTRDRWYRRVRATVIHEVKHIAAHAEWLANDGVREVSWLEESTARLSQELWGRKVYGYTQGQNVGYDPALRCEEQGAARAGCPEDTPRIMLGTFNGLYGFLNVMRMRSPLGRTQDSDASFYNSGWSLVRWAVDHSGRPEKEFLRALTQERRLTGVMNLQDKTGINFSDMIPFWALSFYLDDHPDLETRTEFTQPSWNLRDVVAGMNEDYPSSIRRKVPIEPPNISLGGFIRSVPELRGASADIFILRGEARGSQMLTLQGESGGPRPTNLRIVVVRVE